MKKYIIILLAVFIMFLIGGVLLSKQGQDNTIKLGFVGPLTGFGASWGEEQRTAVDIAVTEINKSGGIKGKKLVVIYEDGKCVEKDAVTAANKLIFIDKVKFIFSVCSAESLAVAPIAEKNKVIMMAMWATHPGLTGFGEYVFRNSYSDESTGRVMADAVNKEYGRVVMFSENSTYANSLRDVFRTSFKGDVTIENYQPGTTDFRTSIVDSLAEKPEAFIINPSAPASGLLVLQQLRQLGFKGQVYGNYFGSVADVWQSKTAEGMIFFNDPFVPENLSKKKLNDNFQKALGRKPNFDFAVSISYDSVYILKQAIERVGSDTSKIKDYLHSLRNYNGVMGTYGFNDKGDAIGYAPSVYQIIKGKSQEYNF